MTLPYSEPGVQIRELESPNFGAPSTAAPTTVALVGPSRGFENVTDVIRLVDQEVVTLSRGYADLSTIRVYDAQDPNAAAFLESNVSSGQRDYTLDLSDISNGTVRISRSMQTDIADGETVVTYFENNVSPAQGSSFTREVTLDRTYSKLADGSLGASGVNGLDANTVTNSLVVQSKGRVPVGDVAIAGSGTQTATITWQVGAAVVKKFQRVYADFKRDGVQLVDQPFQLNNTSAVTISTGLGVITDVVLKNAPNLGHDVGTLTTAALYTKGVNGTDEDFQVGGTGLTLAIRRSLGTTTMNTTDDEIRVRVEYQATSADYWQPTRVTSPADAERKYGAALDAAGNVNSPLSFAAGIAFANGASELVLQALFAPGTPNAQPTGSANDWQSTLQALRTQGVNVIVPILGVGGTVGTSNDTLVASIASAVKNHIIYMAGSDQHIEGIIGTDSTTPGQGSQAARRSLASLLADQKLVVLSPGSLAYVNQLNREIAVGGQYAAAAFAGTLCRYPVQTPLTRKYLVGFKGVNEIVDPQEELKDGAAGLTVLRNNGGVQIKHALTTDTTSIAKRELNVVRAKHYMMTLIRRSIDDQIIGQVIADENAPFTVQVMVGGILETLSSQNIIVTYGGLTARLSESNPTQVEVRFSYKPSFPLNYVSVEFNIDLSTGTITTDTSAQAA